MDDLRQRAETVLDDLSYVHTQHRDRRVDVVAAALEDARREGAREALLRAAAQFRRCEDARLAHAQSFPVGDTRRDIIGANGSEAMTCRHWCEREAARLAKDDAASSFVATLERTRELDAWPDDETEAELIDALRELDGKREGAEGGEL